MTDGFDPVNDDGVHCKDCSWWQASQESLTECMANYGRLRKALNRRAEVEIILWDAYNGKRFLGKENYKELALKLGKADLLIRDRQLMDVLYKKRRLPDAELDQDIALVAHIMQHAEIAAQQLSAARMALGGIVRDEYASDAGMAKATLEAMEVLEESVIPLNERR